MSTKPTGKKPTLATRPLNTTVAKPEHNQMSQHAQTLKERERLAQRKALPMDRMLGSRYPIAFIDDFDDFKKQLDRRGEGLRRIRGNEIIEYAFYLMRQELTGEPIPDWVTRL